MTKIERFFQSGIVAKSALIHTSILALVVMSVFLINSRGKHGTEVAFAINSIVETYPGPGIDTYKSNLYTVDVSNGTSWSPSYTYKYSRLSNVAWHQGTYPSVNFTTFGTDSVAQVQISKIGSSITSIDVSPKSKNITALLSGGKATITINQNDKVWITVNGDDANPLFIFADALKPAVPTGATYFGPGIYDLATSTENHYKAVTNQIIYIDGGAWVRGNFDLTGTKNVQIMGPGVLSGDLWTSEAVQGSTSPMKYVMIYGDWGGKNLAVVSGITIVASPSYNFRSGVSSANGVKLLSPWYYSTDGFQGVNHVDNVFAFIGDNVFFPIWAGINQDNITVTNSFAGNTNNSVICGGFWGNSPSTYTSLTDNVDIKTYGNPIGWGQPTPAVFQIWVDNASSTKGYFNQTYQNIRIEGNLSQPLAQLKNMVYPWGGANVFNPPLGNSHDLVFKNITLTGTQPAHSEIMGWDASNGFNNITLDNLKINGAQITQSNFSNYFDTNSFVTNLNIITPPDITPPTTSITSPTNGARVSRGTTVNIRATAFDEYGISKVEFYVNNSLKCTDTTSPYSCSWVVPSARNVSYSIVSKAYDSSSNTASSSPVNVTSK